MPKSHWELHIQATMDENVADAQLQRQGTAILADLATIQEDLTDKEIITSLDLKQNARLVTGRDAIERDEILDWLIKVDRPVHLQLSLESRITDAFDG